MAGMMHASPRIRDAFFHERLGVVLVCDVITVIEGVEGVQQGDIFYLHTPCDGDPAYLQQVADFLAEHWTDERTTFSTN